MQVAVVVREILKATGLKQVAFAKKIGVGQGTISKWISQKQSPNKTQWDRVVKFASRHPSARHLVAPESEVLAYLPLISWVSAGELVNAESQIPIEDVPLLAFGDLGPGEFFALKVEGDSMDRISPDGSVIVVNKSDRELINGRCYIFSIKGETTYKRWHADPAYLEPDSTNPAHKPQFIKRNKDLEVIGRVRRSVIDL